MIAISTDSFENIIAIGSDSFENMTAIVTESFDIIAINIYSFETLFSLGDWQK